MTPTSWNGSLTKSVKKIADLVRDADEWIYALRQCCTEQVQAGWGRILGESMEKAGMDDAKGILECDVFL